MKKVTEIVAELAAPVAAEFGCELWDTEYVREAGQWFLRLIWTRTAAWTSWIAKT